MNVVYAFWGTVLFNIDTKEFSSVGTSLLTIQLVLIGVYDPQVRKNVVSIL